MRPKPSFVANPLSRKTIRNLARVIRKAVGFRDTLNFPIVHFLEFFMPAFDPDFCLEIVTGKEIGECLAVAYPENHKIVIREDVYMGAVDGVGVHRFTVAHELGHYFLHKNGTVALARIDPEKRLPAYMDPEWQANCFAGELLMSADLIKGMNITDIANGCGVSTAAARTQSKSLK